MRKIIFALLVGAAGCAGGSGTVGYQATATYETAPMPDMAYVSPGVQVIADYDEPVFYTDGYYWRYDSNGTWYRSHTWNGGWVYASAPRPLLSIQSPRTYIRYRPSGYVSRRPARVLRDRYRYDDRRSDRRDRRRDGRYYR
jgi:hypothetical protein